MKLSSVVHSFDESLKKSHELNAEADWVAFYKRIWPEAASIIRVDKYSNIQTRGIDRMIWLPSGKQILVDEKCRDVDYGDVLLEVSSVMKKSPDGNWEELKVGWALDDSKHCDFIAYAIPSANKCYMLPFELTKEALRHNFEAWKLRGRPDVSWPIDAMNNGYKTRSIGVRWCILAAAIKEQMLRRFGSPAQLPGFRVIADQMEFEW